MSGEPLDLERLAAFLDRRLSPEQDGETVRQLADSPELLGVIASLAQRGSNPFQPRGPTKRGTFAGRRWEVDKLLSLLRQTRSGNSSNVLVTGAPGMGKSSLLIQFKAIAEEAHARTSPFIVIHTVIDGLTTQEGLLAKIEAGLQRSLSRAERVRSLFQRFIDVVSHVEAAGFRYHKTDAPVDQSRMERFADHLSRTVNAVTQQRSWFLRVRRDGVLLIIDEADKASPNLRLGSFLKQLVERLRWSDCERFIVAVAGDAGLAEALRSDHHSAMRLFEVIELQRMDDLGGMEIIVEGLKRASQEGERITIQPVALGRLLSLADGLPHFTQQLAYSAFDVNVDDVIDEEDVEEGAYGAGGAVATLGRHYGWSDLPMRGDGSWTLLKTLTEVPDGGLPLETLAESIGVPTDVVREIVQRLMEEGLVVEKGSHERVHLGSHALDVWVRLEATRPPEYELRNRIRG